MEENLYINRVRFDRVSSFNHLLFMQQLGIALNRGSGRKFMMSLHCYLHSLLLPPSALPSALLSCSPALLLSYSPAPRSSPVQSSPRQRVRSKGGFVGTDHYQQLLRLRITINCDINGKQKRKLERGNLDQYNARDDKQTLR